MPHAIILYEFIVGKRTYRQFDDENDALQDIVRVFEKQLSQKTHQSGIIEYEISDVLVFVDNVFDLGLLVCNDALKAYNAYGKPEIKEKLEWFLTRHLCSPLQSKKE
ncbi:Enhancer of rudimentary like protein [Aduncisulcus paluster]|uniref:Enhancer of rudimentary like protein n=1 Tax=Aduncisulcus paluster TaxID=2918883 RepID=A0ABQ5KLX8_9EUKA|nr:Enhancer of rudimentary like protein [Aduncisulcus paluster]